MALTSNRRRELLAQSHGVKVTVVLAAGELDETGIAQVRASFARHELVKVRISGGEANRGDPVRPRQARWSCGNIV